MKVESIIYNEEMFNGQETLAPTRYYEPIDWQQVYDRHLLDDRNFNFLVNNEAVNVHFTIETISGVNEIDFHFTYLDFYSKAVDELNSLTSDTITFEQLYSIKEQLMRKLNATTLVDYKKKGIPYEVELTSSVVDSMPFELQMSADGITGLVAKHLVPIHLKRESEEMPKMIGRLCSIIDEKMIEIPRVRITKLMTDFVLPDELESFLRLESHLTDEGMLSLDGLQTG